MKKSPNKSLTPHYERGNESVITEKSTRVDSKKVISEMSKIIKKSRELERKFKVKQNEALL